MGEAEPEELAPGVGVEVLGGDEGVDVAVGDGVEVGEGVIVGVEATVSVALGVGVAVTCKPVFGSNSAGST